MMNNAHPSGENNPSKANLLCGISVDSKVWNPNIWTVGGLFMYTSMPEKSMCIMLVLILTCCQIKVSDCYLMPHEQFFSHIMKRTSCIR